MMKTLTALLLGSLMVSCVTGGPKAKKLTAAERAEIRMASAERQLRAHPNLVFVYAEGLCCPSCAIGIRKNVRQLDFVDQSRPESGVGLDVKTQLVKVSVKPKHTVDQLKLAKAIDDAGYKPSQYYCLRDGKLFTMGMLSK